MPEFVMLPIMTDSLLSRALLAIQETSAILKQRRAVMDQHDRAIIELRLSIIESASMRAESKAHRDDKE